MTGPVPCRRSEPTAADKPRDIPTRTVACAAATKPMPSTLPPRSWAGRTAANNTSTTRLVFSSTTPVRIQVLYCDSITKTSTSVNTDAGECFLCLFAAGLRPRTGAGFA